MNGITRHLAPAAIIAVAVYGAAAVRADAQQNAYVVTPLVSDLAGKAAVQDPNLKNAWGVTFTPAASPFWIADNANGLSTLYDGDGTIVSLVVTIPCPPTAGKDRAARKARHLPDWCGTRRRTQPRHSWFRERSCRPHSSGTPRTGRYLPGPGASPP